MERDTKTLSKGRGCSWITVNFTSAANVLVYCRKTHRPTNSIYNRVARIQVQEWITLSTLCQNAPLAPSLTRRDLIADDHANSSLLFGSEVNSPSWRVEDLKLWCFWGCLLMRRRTKIDAALSWGILTAWLCWGPTICFCYLQSFSPPKKTALQESK